MSKPKGHIQMVVSTHAGAKTGRHYGEVSCAIRQWAKGRNEFTINECGDQTGIAHERLIGTIRGMVSCGTVELVKHGRNGRGGFPAVYKLKDCGCVQACDHVEQPVQPCQPCCCEEGVHQHEEIQPQQ